MKHEIRVFNSDTAEMLAEIHVRQHPRSFPEARFKRIKVVTESANLKLPVRVKSITPEQFMRGDATQPTLYILVGIAVDTLSDIIEHIKPKEFQIEYIGN